MKLRWHQKLTTKIIGTGLVFFALLATSFVWQYKSLKGELLNATSHEAQFLAENIITTIQTIALKTDSGGSLIAEMVNDVNRRLRKLHGGVTVRLVHSKSIDIEYGPEFTETPINDAEKVSLHNGQRGFYENSEGFNYITPVNSIKGCEKCHKLPDGSGKPIPEGYTLGLAVVTISTAVINKRLEGLLNESLKITALVVSLLLFLVFFMDRYVVFPIKSMVYTIQKISIGEFGEGIKLGRGKGKDSFSGQDEITLLATGINSMSGQLEKSFSRLENWNIELAKEVDDRTEDVEKLKNQYETIIDSTQRVIYTTDRNLEIQYVNAVWDSFASATKLNLKRDEIVGKSILDLTSLEKRKDLSDLCISILKKGKGSVSELCKTELEMVTYGEKKCFGISVSPLMGKDGIATGLVFVSYDITERKKVEEKLSIETETLNIIMDSMKDPVMILEQDCRISRMNRTMIEAFGSSSLGKFCYEVVSGENVTCDECMGAQSDTPSHLQVKTAEGKTYLAVRESFKSADGNTLLVEILHEIS